jgi:Outer membrane protein beta-barrel domain
MRRLVLLTVLALGADAAHADNGFFYIGAGASHNNVSNITDLGNQADISGSSWKAFAGIRPMNVFAVEADYMDLGSGNGSFPPPVPVTCPPGQTCNGAAHSSGTAYAGYLVGFLPIPLPIVDIYGKLGAARWKLDGNINNLVSTPTGFSKSGTDVAWGIGVQAHITMFGARLEYENFNIPNTSGAKIASLSVFLNLF